jgi:lipopolysaccharide export system protein LptC
VGIGLILGATVLMTWLDPLRVLVRLPVDHGGLVISGTKITMQAPRLNGYTRDQRWYEVTATAAGQDITKPDLIDLHGIRAKIEAQDKSTIDLAAQDGVFNRKASILTLTKNIIVKTSTGSEMHLEEAAIDTGNGEIVSNKPVAVFTDQGTLNADRLEIYNSGDAIHFIGNVVMNLNGSADAKPADKPQENR